LKARVDAAAVAISSVSRTRTADFLELTKPRITLLVLATVMVAFYAGTRGSVRLLLLFHTLVGTGLVAGGASAFNMYLERNLDALMRRTNQRPLPAGRLQSGEVLTFALLISIAGIVYLFALVNPLTSLLSAITFLSYLFLYTPLKTRTWLCTLAGAVPGALPAAMGWTAVTGGMSLEAWVLSGMIFFWQLPHFYALGWLFREDYARAGFPMLPVVDESGGRTSLHVTAGIAALILVTIIPTAIGMAGLAYLLGALAGGLIFLGYGVSFARLRDRRSARRLFLASVCYLPILLTLLMVDKAAR